MKRSFAVSLAVVLAISGVAASIFLARDDNPTLPAAPASPTPFVTPTEEPPPLPKKAYLRRACKMPSAWVTRIHRGWSPGRARDLDLVIVPTPPNYMGTFINTSHSAPYEFLQAVPLVLYGPGFVAPQGHVGLSREVTIADLAPTYADLMGFGGFPDRASSSFRELLKPTDKAPRLILTAVIDGAGWNVLDDYWPDATPNLRRLIDEGMNVDNAIVGSSPSITPATHTNISTGTFPRFHGVTAIAVRADDGSIVGSFSEDAGNPGAAVMDPTVSLRKTTLADLWDRARGNRPKIGMLAAGNLQLGMVGHGSALKGGDRDIVAIRKGEGWATNPAFYSLPEYVNTEVEGPARDIDAVDRADGKADGKWRGHAIDPIDGSPAFAPWENRTMQAIFEREGFGADRVTDLFYVNYKAPDKAGHKYNMIGPEQEDALRSVDEALGDMVAWLDDNVGQNNYLFVVTADHGQTPLEAGGWPINRAEITADINARFDRIDNGRNIIQRTSASSFFSNVPEMRANEVTPEQVSSFLSGYTIGNNIPDGEPLPKGFEARADEPIFSAVFPGRKLPQVRACHGL